jgi:choline kinase
MPAEFRRKNLLEPQLRLLRQKGLPTADLVVGYRSEQIVQQVENLPDRPRVNFIFNPDFEKGSVLSLHVAHRVMCSGEDILLMDADVRRPHEAG